MVLQGMGWASLGNDLFTLKPMPGQWPTYEESRFMAWDAVVRGARGILYWGTHVEAKDSECWKGIARVVRELADPQFLLAASDAAVTPSVETTIFGLLPFAPGDGGLGVQVLGKVVDGKTWWLVVNEYFFPVTYTLRGLEEADGTKYADTATAAEAAGIAALLPLALNLSVCRCFVPHPHEVCTGLAVPPNCRCMRRTSIQLPQAKKGAAKTSPL